MQAFQSGPFVLTPSQRSITVNGAASCHWQLAYGATMLAEMILTNGLSKEEIRQGFLPYIDAFITEHQKKTTPAATSRAPEPTYLSLVESTEVTGEHGKVLGRFVAYAEVPGMTVGLIDDRFATWLVTGGRHARSVPMTAAEFERLRAAHEALQPMSRTEPDAFPYRWIAELLPEHTTTDNPAQWRAPTSWEIRHVVGEGSFTGIPGARAAALVGVTPQNFRKYTAADGARSQQAMSYAMWHLLLHKLGVQAA